MEDSAVQNNVLPFKEGLLKARSHIVFILGLIVAFGTVIALESWQDPRGKNAAPGTPAATQGTSQGAAPAPASAQGFALERTMPFALPGPVELSSEEMEWARIAWKYFENNTVPETGFVNSVDKYYSTTMWDTGSYLLAMISARRLNIIDRAEFDRRLKKVLASLTAMPLADTKLPNKAYSTKALQMTRYNNAPSQHGIGWSAIDLGRLVAPLSMIVWSYPEHAAAVKNVFSKWKLDAVVRNGMLYGAAIDTTGKVKIMQEGRLGYEEYAARPLGQLGLDVSTAARYDLNFATVEINGVELPVDARDPRKLGGGQNYVLSEPYILEGLEFGLNTVSQEMAWRVYKAQEERYAKTGTLTSVSEDHVDREPWFIYNTVYNGGKEWAAITDKGKEFPELRTVSTKAAFGWDALFRTDYTRKLVDKVKNLADPARGWYAGVYEQSQAPNKAVTCNTNAVILESLAYKKLGPAFKVQ